MNCKYCNKPITPNWSNKQFCNRECCSLYHISKKSCIVCGKSFDSTFYDKSNYRPICSKACYSKYYDNLPDRYAKNSCKDTYTEDNKITGHYYRTGKLVLANYKL